MTNELLKVLRDNNEALREKSKALEKLVEALKLRIVQLEEYIEQLKISSKLDKENNQMLTLMNNVYQDRIMELNEVINNIDE